MKEKVSSLIISSKNNSHALAIHRRLKDKGLDCAWLNTDALEQSEIELSGNGLEVNGRRYKSAFCHNPKIFPYKRRNDFSDRLDEQVYLAEWEQMLINLSPLTELKWFNQPYSRQSRSLTNQYHIAKDLGFETPRTIFTNSLECLRKFFKGYRGNIVVKPGNLDLRGGVTRRILTNLIYPDCIDGNILKNAPCIFQEYINKKYELRVYVIGRTALACKIESQKSSISKIDWRRYDIVNTPYSATQLDKRLCETLSLLVDRLGLGYGAVDLIVTPEERHVFLECNSNPSWLWVEKLTGLPITDKIVEVMAGH